MKKIRSTGTINFRDTHNGGFAFRGIDRQLAFSHKPRAQGPRDAMKSVHECIFRRHATSKRSSAPEGQIIPEVVIEAPGLSPAEAED
jgi:hypothetical protein